MDPDACYKVITMTPSEAAENGWVAGLNNDARYHDLRRTYGDHSPQVNRHLASCVAAQASGENHT